MRKLMKHMHAEITTSACTVQRDDGETEHVGYAHCVEEV